jgi:DNA-binding NarL/FixJ family response regulator
MENPRFVIVDDSAFSIMYIKNILESNGYAVVGEAGTLEEVIRVVKEQRPDVVTMDITLPGTDGLECTRAIHAIDENIKVIVISSMMDDEIVNKARKTKFLPTFKSPLRGRTVMVIQSLQLAEALLKTLQEEYFTVF